MTRLAFFLVLCGFLARADGLSCGSTMGYLSARTTAQSLLSPGYPSDYENNQDCKWLISTQDAKKKIQVEVVSMEIANWDGGECEDYLEIRDGKEEDSPLIKRWCDSDPVQFKTQGQHLLVKFVTNQHIAAPGFALKYYHVDDYKSQCDPYRVRTLSVGENPLFLDLPMYSDRMSREVSCDYHFKSEYNDDVTINLELLSFSPILCEDGSFAIYDGSNANGPIILDWCHSNQPFRHISSSGKNLFLRFRLIKTQSDWFVFRAKVTTKTKSTSCNEKSIPNLELTPTPTFLAFPQQHKPRSSQTCPLRLWTQKQSQTVRLEVITPDPLCGDKGVSVHDGYDLDSKSLGSLCDKEVFSSSTHNMVLNPINNERTGVVFLKASAIEATCNSKVEQRHAIHDEVRRLPQLANSKSSYAHDLNCSYLLESDRTTDSIEVSLTGRMVTRGMYECDGDSVTFYDGETTSSPLIATWCGANGQRKRHVSRGPKMLVVVNTDSFDSYDGVNLTYYAVPQKGGCKMVTELTANSTVQHITSPNYPLYYPINSYCEYKLTAPEDQIVHFEVLHSRMENDCSDTVKLYNGLERKYDKYIGRWCGDEKPKYQSEGREMLVVFSADDEFNSGGFKAKFYADSGKSSGYLVPAIVGSLLFATAIIIVIVIVYIVVQRRKRNESGA